jgi:hypothetical protein
MAKARTAEETHEARRLVGYRLRRGFVLFTGRTHRALLAGEVVPAEDAVVTMLFRGGADLEQVLE